MQRRLLSTLALLGVLLAIAAVSFVHSARQSILPDRSAVIRSSPVVKPKPEPAPAPVAHSYGLPVQLQIAKLKVDAKVQYLGKTKTGTMDTPGNVIDVGWYKYGALPGNTGTAVIAGHLDGLKAEPGVFSQLKLLQPGDTVTVRDSAGATVSFIVRTTKNYSQNDEPAEVFTSAEGSHLNLITCTGAWDKTAHQFAQRLVVFTDRI